MELFEKLTVSQRLKTPSPGWQIQREEALSTEPGGQAFIPKTHMVGEENRFPQVAL